jgi:outer membrane protein assembly factor BamB
MGLASSPILVDNLVIVVADQQERSYIAAFDRRRGEMRWKTDRHEKDGWATPVLFQHSGGPPYVLTVSRGEFGAHRADTGARAWTLDTLSPAIVSSPVLVNNTLYTFGYGNESASPFSGRLARNDKNGDGVISREEQGTDAFLIGIGKYEGNRDGTVTKEEWDEKQRQVLAPSRLMAIRMERDAESGKIQPRELWRHDRNFIGVIPSVLHYEDVLYIMRNGGILTTFDAETGAMIKTARVEGALGGYSASPVAAAGHVYLANEDGKVAVLRAGREWELVALNDLGESCYATPALSGGSIYLRTMDALYCFRSAE